MENSKKVIIRQVKDRGDGVKTVTIPKKSNIDSGDYIKITKMEVEK